MLSKEKIDFYRRKLEEEERAILKEIEEGKQKMDFGDDVDSFEEEADEAEEESTRLGIDAVLTERLNHIRIALGKIQDGTYGTCAKCGAEIEEEVLNVAPESDFCRTCKAKEQKPSAK
ncbi:hypothetical protein D6779_06090 [Candidatus Parcubacteria bacterium]|nr:MAG: hypothetical protein D6779_06090 [Candidatus Parcubacteria bacterium]